MARSEQKSLFTLDLILPACADAVRPTILDAMREAGLQ